MISNPVRRLPHHRSDISTYTNALDTTTESGRGIDALHCDELYHADSDSTVYGFVTCFDNALVHNVMNCLAWFLRNVSVSHELQMLMSCLEFHVVFLVRSHTNLCGHLLRTVLQSALMLSQAIRYWIFVSLHTQFAKSTVVYAAQPT